MHAIKKLLLMVFGCLWLTNSALAQDTAKASDTAANTSHRYKVIGNIFVDVPGEYPSGYQPNWAISQRNTIFTADLDRSVTSRTYQDKDIIAYLDEGDKEDNDLGRVEFAWKPAAFHICVANISDSDAPILLSSTSRTFHLINPRFNHESQPCRSHYTNAEGDVTLAADNDGNIIMSFQINARSDRGNVSDRFVSNPQVFKNLMTPQLALADIEKKKQAAIDAQKAKLAAEDAEKQHQLRITARATRKMTKLESEVDAIIQADSRSWLYWHYDSRSVTNAKYLERSKDHHSAIIYAEYTFNDERPGWVEIKITNNNIECLQFWNEGGCRAMGNPPSHGVINGILNDMMNPQPESMSELQRRQRNEDGARLSIERNRKQACPRGEC